MKLVEITGPEGVGKTTLIHGLLQRYPDFYTKTHKFPDKDAMFGVDIYRMFLDKEPWTPEKHYDLQTRMDANRVDVLRRWDFGKSGVCILDRFLTERKVYGKLAKNLGPGPVLPQPAVTVVVLRDKALCLRPFTDEFDRQFFEFSHEEYRKISGAGLVFFDNAFILIEEAVEALHNLIKTRLEAYVHTFSDNRGTYRCG